jgi:hypothetical protein
MRYLIAQPGVPALFSIGDGFRHPRFFVIMLCVSTLAAAK